MGSISGRAGWGCSIVLAACTAAGGSEGSDGSFGTGEPTPPGSESTADGGSSEGGSTTSPGCACEPGAIGGCDGDDVLVCAEDCSDWQPQSCAPFGTCVDGACMGVACQPGETVCSDDGAVLTCADDGAGFGPPSPCGPAEGCLAGACQTLCELATAAPSSVGCSFLALKMDNYYAGVADALVVGNPSEALTATVQLYESPGGIETPVGAMVMLAPGEVVQLELDGEEFDAESALRTGGSFRVESDIPVVAYQHSPIGGQATNDASMLLPEHALAQEHVIASYPGSYYAGHLSYFDVIATVDGTTVTWVSPVATLAGDGVAAVPAGGMGMVTLDRHDTLQVAAAFGVDVSGTIVVADHPVWVMGASACPSVPVGANTCDHIEEQMLPITYWGQTYVAAHAPTRGSEDYHWRIFAGEDGVQITTTPDQTGGPVVVDRGQWVELITTESFVIEADGPVLPVQYLESQNQGAGTGDPAMIQLVPAEQFLDRYAFATGTDYDVHYVQVTRPIGGPAVRVDGTMVEGFSAVGAGYEVADWEIGEGSHVAESDGPFGIVSVGYTTITSYGYPGGMRLMALNPEG
ncbi:IgGFc-binding protein [Paraliomyxa miuraensis]|uniref:IgGFc-binding protein n=1 Tax=Paraliomyxa miuraensis TaxID=376150 RepID=UPI00225C228E|nr:IgGFc-binding protein [Paraliomyxa miuraensis]MCX4243076.1 IgGFc-binding protein [Paraliomyxa miuraensis]